MEKDVTVEHKNDTSTKSTPEESYVQLELISVLEDLMNEIENDSLKNRTDTTGKRCSSVEIQEEEEDDEDEFFDVSDVVDNDTISDNKNEKSDSSKSNDQCIGIDRKNKCLSENNLLDRAREEYASPKKSPVKKIHFVSVETHQLEENSNNCNVELRQKSENNENDFENSANEKDNSIISSENNEDELYIDDDKESENISSKDKSLRENENEESEHENLQSQIGNETDGSNATTACDDKGSMNKNQQIDDEYEVDEIDSDTCIDDNEDYISKTNNSEDVNRNISKMNDLKKLDMIDEGVESDKENLGQNEVEFNEKLQNSKISKETENLEFLDEEKNKALRNSCSVVLFKIDIKNLKVTDENMLAYACNLTSPIQTNHNESESNLKTERTNRSPPTSPRKKRKYIISSEESSEELPNEKDFKLRVKFVKGSSKKRPQKSKNSSQTQSSKKQSTKNINRIKLTPETSDSEVENPNKNISESDLDEQCTPCSSEAPRKIPRKSNTGTPNMKDEKSKSKKSKNKLKIKLTPDTSDSEVEYSNKNISESDVDEQCAPCSSEAPRKLPRKSNTGTPNMKDEKSKSKKSKNKLKIKLTPDTSDSEVEYSNKNIRESDVDEQCAPCSSEAPRKIPRKSNTGTPNMKDEKSKSKKSKNKLKIKLTPDTSDSEVEYSNKNIIESDVDEQYAPCSSESPRKIPRKSRTGAPNMEDEKSKLSKNTTPLKKSPQKNVALSTKRNLKMEDTNPKKAKLQLEQVSNPVLTSNLEIKDENDDKAKIIYYKVPKIVLDRCDVKQNGIIPTIKNGKLNSDSSKSNTDSHSIVESTNGKNSRKNQKEKKQFSKNIIHKKLVIKSKVNDEFKSISDDDFSDNDDSDPFDVLRDESGPHYKPTKRRVTRSKQHVTLPVERSKRTSRISYKPADSDSSG